MSRDVDVPRPPESHKDRDPTPPPKAKDPCDACQVNLTRLEKANEDPPEVVKARMDAWAELGRRFSADPAKYINLSAFSKRDDYEAQAKRTLNAANIRNIYFKIQGGNFGKESSDKRYAAMKASGNFNNEVAFRAACERLAAPSLVNFFHWGKLVEGNPELEKGFSNIVIQQKYKKE